MNKTGIKSYSRSTHVFEAIVSFVVFESDKGVLGDDSVSLRGVSEVLDVREAFTVPLTIPFPGPVSITPEAFEVPVVLDCRETAVEIAE